MAVLMRLTALRSISNVEAGVFNKAEEGVFPSLSILFCWNPYSFNRPYYGIQQMRYMETSALQSQTRQPLLSEPGDAIEYPNTYILRAFSFEL